jgi:hypothetical protein
MASQAESLQQLVAFFKVADGAALHPANLPYRAPEAGAAPRRAVTAELPHLPSPAPHGTQAHQAIHPHHATRPHFSARHDAPNGKAASDAGFRRF